MESQGKIPFIAAVLMSINIIVGAGIFANPQFMSAKAGSYGFLGWPLSALFLFPLIWVVAHAARVFPGEGGFYNYCKNGINESAGFIANWAYLLGYLGTAASITSVIRSTLVTRAGLTCIEEYAIIFNILFVVVISLLNMVSIELISKIQSFVTLLKLIPLFFIVGIFFFYFNPGISYPASDLVNIGYTLPFAVFGFWGFESCCSISHLIKGGSTQASRVILIAFSITAILYTIFHFGVLNIMGIENLTTYGASAFPAYLGFSPVVTNVIAAGISSAIMLSFLNTVYGASLTNITNIYGFARKKIIFGSSLLAKTTHNGTPINTVWIHALALFGLLTFISNTAVLMAFTTLGVSVALFLTIIAMTRYDIKHKLWGQFAVTILALALLIGLLFFTWLQVGPDNVARLINTLPLIIGIPLGFIMYKMLSKKNNK